MEAPGCCVSKQRQPHTAYYAETLKITTQDFVCIAQTVTEELVLSQAAEVHVEAGAHLATISMPVSACKLRYYACLSFFVSIPVKMHATASRRGCGVQSRKRFQKRALREMT